MQDFSEESRQGLMILTEVVGVRLVVELCTRDLFVTGADDDAGGSEDQMELVDGQCNIPGFLLHQRS